MSLIIAMPILGTIIMIHEFGHFSFAKLNGIGVIEFSLGMGPRLFGFERDDIRYSSKILSSGSSCMALGEDERITDENASNNKSVWARIPAVAIGPVLNFILAFGLPMVLIGIMGYGTARLAGVVNGCPAQVAGVKTGNVAKSTNDRKVHSYRDTSWYLFIHPQKSLAATWERTEERGEAGHFSTELVPVLSMEDSQYMMGVQFSPVPNIAESTGQLLVYSAYEVQYWVHYVFDTFYMMFRGMVFVNDISGPVGIVNTIDTTVDEAASYGMSAVVLMLVNFTILLSVNLGITDSLPIPTLDGGCLILLTIEAVKRKPIDKEEEGMIHMAGMAVLLTLVAFISFNDVWGLF